ncbi:NAD(P)/FAD-dependent oxidoreductase [Siminovitchia fordii]|uniref:Gamma-glutamylputrescine oxidoreductase n=1 Tax=Siminovitchia fordii TaxID=254759 RepID=A0ABQ4KCW8_9BACI|nr:FAD-binding oxidoreductase [Siminovitchia fordii]GIN23025.1 gamma-glutamylputrescine oxidoreductase [Siminovitchia fordii]
METATLWEVTSEYRRTYPLLQEHITSDVVIIGGGFTGIASSYHLQNKGVQTVVLEQHKVGWGASGRNGGMMNTGYKLSAADTIKRWGVEEAKRLDQYALDCNKAVEEIAKKHQIDCDVRMSGHVGLSKNKKKQQAFERSQELIEKHFGRKVRVLTGAELQEEMNSDYYKVGLMDPLSYQFHPLDYVRGLAEVTHDLGADIYEQTKAIDVQKTGSTFIVTTEKGMVEAKELIFATDGYSEKITPELHKGIFPLASFVIATEPLEKETLENLIPNNRNLYDTINLVNYFRRTPDNRIIFGGSGIGYPAKQAFKDELYMLLTSVFPRLKGVNIDYFWGGIIGATVDKFPIIGRTAQGAYYSVGYTGHGAAQSTLHGKLLAQCILNEERLNTTFENTPLKTVPLYTNKKFLVSAANLYFRMLDKLG